MSLVFGVLRGSSAAAPGLLTSSSAAAAAAAARTLTFPCVGATASLPQCLSGPLSSLLGATRGKRAIGGGGTRWRGGHPPGKKRGVKVYDGQRVPAGSVLATQLGVKIFPGWNVRFAQKDNLCAECHGRVMITTERMDPKYSQVRRNTSHACEYA